MTSLFAAGTELIDSQRAALSWGAFMGGSEGAVEISVVAAILHTTVGDLESKAYVWLGNNAQPHA